MDPEIKRLLEETRALARDNHRMLRAIRREHWLGLIARLIIWAVVILLPLYIYQQYLGPLIKAVVPTTATSTNAFGLPSSADIQKLINSAKAGQ